MTAAAVSTTATATPILELRDISLHFGGITALDGVGFTVNRGEIFAVIGPNGAGKTSVFNCISGLYHPAKGSILFEGRDITGLTPAQRARLGLARSFQLTVIAEGVESIAHGERLIELGCDLAQGYGIARPMPADAVPDWANNYIAPPQWRAAKYTEDQI